MMIRNLWKTLRTIFPWCLLVLVLSGCGTSLWQAAGAITDDTEQAQQWLDDGWPLLQTGLPLSANLWQMITGTVPTNPYYQMISGFPVLLDQSGKTVRYSTEEEAFYASAFV